MLGPDVLEHLPDALAALWQQVEDDILRDVARRLRKAGILTETAAYQAARLEVVRALQRDITGTLARYSGRSRAEIRRMLTEASTQTLARDDEIHRLAGKSPAPVNESSALLNLLNAGYRQTLGSWQNLTATTAATVTGEFEARLDRAWLQVSSGAFDYNTAIRRAVDDLADSMKYVTYPSGHKDTLEVAVRRCVLTGANQTAGKLQLTRMEEMGCAFVEVTAHRGARPSHAAWQGKIYHRGGEVVLHGVQYADFEAATGYGTGPGLCGWNCRHNFYPFYPGVSTPNYTPEKLAELNARDVPYQGGLYTRYEIRQMQRELERKVRKYKRRYLAESEAGLDAGGTAARLKAARRQLAEFIRDTGGHPDSARTSVQGFGHSAGSKAAANARKRTTTELRQKNRGEKVAITDIAIQKVPLVAPNRANQQTALFIQETHKELLRFAQKQNNSNEVACLLDLTTGEKLDFVKGDQTSVDIERDAASYHWLRTRKANSIMLCHNHPGQSYFSDNDLVLFLEHGTIGFMSIVTNLGKVWVISKTQNYNFRSAFSEFEKCILNSNGNYDKAIDSFLRSGYNYGIERR